MKHLIVALIAALSLSCASFTAYGPPPISMVPQRGMFDCGVAVIAMVVGEGYERVSGVLSKNNIDPDNNQGMFDRDTMRGAELFGVYMFPSPLKDWNGEEGILHVKWTMTDIHHYMYLKGGWLYDPLNRMPVHHQVATRNWELITFLKVVRREPRSVHKMELLYPLSVY